MALKIVCVSAVCSEKSKDIEKIFLFPEPLTKVIGKTAEVRYSG